ncbi:hypothetical protein [Deinococcus koreensis]|nr:hypothetical protein [Deinococcus koreensis]
MRRLPLSAALVGLSLVLGACADISLPDPTILTLQGKATGVSFPNGNVYLASGNGVNTDNVGTLSAPDTFRLTATTPPRLESAFDMLTVPGCTFSGQASDQPKIHFYDQLKVMTPQGDPIGYIREVITSGGTEPFSVVARVYSDRAATTQGTLQCGSAAKVVYAVTLRPGWNAVEYAVASNSATMKTLPPGVTTEFRSDLNLPYVTVELAPATLKFTTNDTFTVSATFYQNGGYNGEFPISTDIEGLTVEPASVTLSDVYELGLRPANGALQSLGIGAQALRRQLTFRYTGTQNGTRPFVLSLSDPYGGDAGRGDGMLVVERP